MTLTEEQIKYILEHCPNYDEIVNFAIPEGDLKSPDVLRNYRAYIFDPHEITDESLEKIMHLDKMVKEYTDCGEFYRFIQSLGDGPLFDEKDEEYIVDFYEYFDLLYKNHETKSSQGRIGTKWL